MDWTCAECERLWREYDIAAEYELIIERNAAIESGLEIILRKAAKRSEGYRKAIQDHDATHATPAAVARANG